ncbi:MAG: glutaminyl-peptide cyclotransferase [Acidobacteria bacterium]|nr:glutaminyl-peptide cyclotransferase [Acidobacteriota bacterium]
MIATIPSYWQIRYDLNVFARIVVALAAVLAALAQQPAPKVPAKIIRTFPHDTQAFTQGLEFSGGALWESTGMVGRSGIRKVQLETGKVLQELRLSPPYFGEGITIVAGKLFQLTWQHQTGLVYEMPSLKFVKQFSYPGEGWGLTNDGKNIYMSDGTAQIRVIDPATQREIRRINVRDGGRPVANLNELEWVRGEIYANIWTTDTIARIRPLDGTVTGYIDCAHLPRDREFADVLNGIAYDAVGRRLIVTGKQWARIYEIAIPNP